MTAWMLFPLGCGPPLPLRWQRSCSPWGVIRWRSFTTSVAPLPTWGCPLLHYLVTAMLFPLGVYFAPCGGSMLLLLQVVLHWRSALLRPLQWQYNCSPYRWMRSSAGAPALPGMSFHFRSTPLCPPISTPPITLPRTSRYDWTVGVRKVRDGRNLNNPLRIKVRR